MTEVAARTRNRSFGVRRAKLEYFLSEARLADSAARLAEAQSGCRREPPDANKPAGFPIPMFCPPEVIECLRQDVALYGRRGRMFRLQGLSEKILRSLAWADSQFALESTHALVVHTQSTGSILIAQMQPHQHLI